MDNILSILFSHGVWWSYPLAGALSFGESLAFIGLFIPGSIMVISMGMLASRGVIDIIPLFIWASVGAILGDYVSYWLGRRGVITFKQENRFFTTEVFERGKRYVHEHGAKSVFFGRFIGWIRPIVPFVVGTFHLSQRRFLPWSILSGVLWAVSHITFGYFLSEGLHLLGKWAFRLEEAVFIFGAIVVFGWTVWVVFKRRRTTKKTNDPA